MEALQYVLDNVQGETKPLITDAFWGGIGKNCLAIRLYLNYLI